MDNRMHHDDGYRIFESVFAPTEMPHVADELSRTELARTRAGARHLLRVPAVCELARDPRVLDLAREFVGQGAVPFRATLFDKSCHANWLVTWHQDTALPLRRRVESPEWGPWTTKAGVLYAHGPAWALRQVVALRVSLDDSDAANGPLRVLPNTHRSGILPAAEIEHLSRTITPVDCLAASGSVVAMRPLIVHASSKATSERPRRVLHIEYAATIHVAAGLELALA